MSASTWRLRWSGLGEQVRLDLPGFDQPAASRHAATTPTLLRWFAGYNRAKSYRAQVRPFGFLYAFQTRRRAEDVNEVLNGRRRRKREFAEQLPRAVAPYDKDVGVAAQHCFDRTTGGQVPSELLPTYRQVLAQYHLQPEDKFLKGDYADSGLTRCGMPALGPRSCSTATCSSRAPVGERCGRDLF